MNTSNEVEVRQLARPDGTIGYQLEGTGPLVVCAPGMGDLRASYRFLAPALIAAGYRVAITDLRGQGDSTTGFADYGDQPTADDLAALITELGGPAVVIGNSMAGSAAILLAAAHPELVRGLVLLDAFGREPASNAVTRAAMWLTTSPLWVAWAWGLYLPKLFAGVKPADDAEYRAAVVAAMRRPGYAAAFSRLARTLTHAAVEPALASVTAPALVMVGALDPDYRDPAAEATWLAEQLNGTSVVVPDSGHYPHAQRPEVVNPVIVDFVQRLDHA